MTDNVLVPLDGSEMADDALEYALENHSSADLTLLHVLNVSGLDAIAGPVVTIDDHVKKQFEDNAEKLFESATERAEEMGHEGEIETVTEKGDPTDLILEYAQDVDVVVMGSHGREGFGRKVLGSVAETVVRRSPVPVVVVK